jgi:peroxiredoxin
MTEIHDSTPNKGLSLGEKAPMIDTEDIDGENVNLNDLLNRFRGVLIDFFRGSW